MISVNQTIDIIKNNQPEKKVKTVSLFNAHGSVLAKKIHAKIPSPPYTNSAMDGFAMHWKDVAQADENNPIELSIVGESSAGHPYEKKVGLRCAVRISTGAIVPKELDCVVPVELCNIKDNVLTIHKVNKQNQHIRFSGEEFQDGQLLLKPGTELKSAQIALVASQGISIVHVYSAPKVAIMTTGSELVAYNDKADSHQLYNSNMPMIYTAVSETVAEITITLHINDDPKVTKEMIEVAAKRSDIIISTGGVSMGAHDHVRDMALKAGFSELFWKVRQKPGKPMFLAKRDQVLLIALPGNPVSAYICFKHYIYPLLKSMVGKTYAWTKVKAYSRQVIENKGDKTQFMRVNLVNENTSSPEFKILDKQGSHMLSSIAYADGYIIVGEGQKIEKKSAMDVYLF